MKVEKYTLYKMKYNLLNRKDIFRKEQLIQKKPRKKMFLDFKDFKPNVFKFLKK